MKKVGCFVTLLLITMCIQPHMKQFTPPNDFSIKEIIGLTMPPDRQQIVKNVISSAIIYCGEDMLQNAKFIQYHIDSYFGSKWVVVIFYPRPSSAWAYWVYYDNAIFLFDYEKLGWSYAVWQSGL